MNRNLLRGLQSIAFVAAVGLACCTHGGDQPTALPSEPDTLAAPDGLALGPPLPVLLPGQTTQATVEAGRSTVEGYRVFWGPDGVSQHVTWTSKNPSVATVDAAGKVTAHSAGSATIVVQSLRAASVTAMTTALVTAAPLHFTKIAGGGETCALTADGSAYCWGVNYAQTGDTTDAVHAGPARVSTNLHFRAISVGGSAYWTRNLEAPEPPYGQATACGTTTGALYCWGFGYGQANEQGVSDPVPTAIDPALTFDSVSVGQQSACAIATDHQTYCWGRKLYGLGDGNPPPQDPVAVADRPVAVVGGLRFQSISVGSQTCGLIADGTAYCWGQQPTQVPGDIKFTAIASAGSITCGLSLTHELYCWGQSYYVPELYAGSASPVHVGDDRQYTALTGYTGYATVVCALDMSDAAFCMGSGDAEWNTSGDPSLVPGGLTFTAVTAGPTKCGIASDKVYCWGVNWTGSNGTLATPSDGSPALVAGQQP